MAIINRFCFTCSVRLGAIIIAIATLIQTVTLLIFTISSMDSLSLVQENLNNWLNKINLNWHCFQTITNNPNVLIITSSVFLAVLITSAILCLYGSVYCKSYYIYPFAVCYLIYIIGLVATFLLLMLFVKSGGSGLGDLILYWNLGGFILLFYLYSWTCIVSLIQIIDELKLRLERKLKAAERFNLATLIKNNKLLKNQNNKNKNRNAKISHHHNYTNFNR